MKVLISSTEITINEGYAFEYASGKRELRLTIPQANIEYAGLKELLAANTGEIVLTNDDGTTQTFSGYKFTPEITDKTENDEAVFYVVIQCVAEAERKALEAIAQVVELSGAVIALKEENQLLNEELLNTQLALCELYEQSFTESEVQ